MPGEWSAPGPTWWVDIRLPRDYDGATIESRPGVVSISFASRNSADGAADEMRMRMDIRVREEHTVVAGEVLSDPLAIQGAVEDTGDDTDAAS
jgi:hypothetical protein